MQGKRARRYLSENALCVILGDALTSRLLAMGLRSFKGLGCVICDRRRSPWGYAFPVGVFYRLYADEAELVCQQLTDVSEEGGEQIKLLLPSKAQYSAVMSDKRDILECRYLYSDKKKIFKMKL